MRAHLTKIVAELSQEEVAKKVGADAQTKHLCDLRLRFYPMFVESLMLMVDVIQPFAAEFATMVTSGKPSADNLSTRCLMSDVLATVLGVKSMNVFLRGSFEQKKPILTTLFELTVVQIADRLTNAKLQRVAVDSEIDYSELHSSEEVKEAELVAYDPLADLPVQAIASAIHGFIQAIKPRLLQIVRQYEDITVAHLAIEIPDDYPEELHFEMLEVEAFQVFEDRLSERLGRGVVIAKFDMVYEDSAVMHLRTLDELIVKGHASKVKQKIEQLYGQGPDLLIRYFEGISLNIMAHTIEPSVHAQLQQMMLHVCKQAQQRADATELKDEDTRYLKICAIIGQYELTTRPEQPLDLSTLPMMAKVSSARGKRAQTRTRGSTVFMGKRGKAHAPEHKLAVEDGSQDISAQEAQYQLTQDELYRLIFTLIGSHQYMPRHKGSFSTFIRTVDRNYMAAAGYVQQLTGVYAVLSRGGCDIQQACHHFSQVTSAYVSQVKAVAYQAVLKAVLGQGVMTETESTLQSILMKKPAVSLAAQSATS